MVSFLTDTVVCGFSLYHILAYFLIYSCIGWCLEVIYAAVSTWVRSRSRRHRRAAFWRSGP